MAEFKVFGESDNEVKREPRTGGGFNKVKKLFKKKPFVIAVIAVTVLGLIAWAKKSSTPQTASEDEAWVVADGVELMGASGSAYGSTDSMYIADVLDSMVDSFGSAMDEMQTQHENEIFNIQDTFTSEIESVKHSFSVTVDSMSQQIEDLSDIVDTQSDVVSQQSEAIAKQQAIAAMQQNSDAWFYAETDAERQALADTNAQIGASMGWTRGDDGLWYDGSTPVYQTVTQKQNQTTSTPANKTLSSGGSSGSSGSSTSSDIATMKANSAAWHGASPAEQTRLNNANKQIAAKNGWTYNSSTGTYHDSSGKRVY